MADLLRWGVLEPSLAYAFLMKRGGQQVPEAKTKAKGRTRGRAPTNEGAVSAPDVSPPRLQPERPHCVREGRNTSTLDSTSKSSNITQEPSISAVKFLFN